MAAPSAEEVKTEGWIDLRCDILHCHNMEIEPHVECPVRWREDVDGRVVEDDEVGDFTEYVCACPCHQQQEG